MYLQQSVIKPQPGLHGGENLTFAASNPIITPFCKAIKTIENVHDRFDNAQAGRKYNGSHHFKVA
jgi:hypothetical protein